MRQPILATFRISPCENRSPVRRRTLWHPQGAMPKRIKTRRSLFFNLCDGLLQSNKSFDVAIMHILRSTFDTVCSACAEFSCRVKGGLGGASLSVGGLQLDLPRQIALRIEGDLAGAKHGLQSWNRRNLREISLGSFKFDDVQRISNPEDTSLTWWG